VQEPAIRLSAPRGSVRADGSRTDDRFSSGMTASSASEVLHERGREAWTKASKPKRQSPQGSGREEGGARPARCATMRTGKGAVLAKLAAMPEPRIAPWRAAP